jgi:hypothetical protein
MMRLGEVGQNILMLYSSLMVYLLMHFQEIKLTVEIARTGFFEYYLNRKFKSYNRSGINAKRKNGRRI